MLITPQNQQHRR